MENKHYPPLLLVASLLLSACSAGVSSVTYPPRKHYRPCTVKRIITRDVEASALPYVEEFSKDAISHQASCYGVRNLVISDMVGDFVAGYCLPRLVVVLSKTFWEWASPLERRTLVYHELGHCSLGLEHGSPDDMADIMNPYVLPDDAVEDNWPQLVDRLFEGETNVK